MELPTKTLFKDANGIVIGYCDNFRVDERGYVVCDTHYDTSQLHQVIIRSPEFIKQVDEPLIIEPRKD